MGISIETLVAAKKFTSETVLGGGAVVGKNVTISSITPIDGGNRVTFLYTLDNGTVKTSTMDVMDGKDGVDGTNGKNGKDGQPGKDGVDGVTPNFTIGTVETLPSGTSATATITGDKENPVLNLGIPKGVDGTNGLTSTQITLLENVLYACAFTDANGKSKVDALINSLRNGTSTDTDTKPEVPPSDDTTIYDYTDIIESTFESGKFNWGIGYKLNETTGDIEEDIEYAISPLIYVSNGSTFSIDNYLGNGQHYIIIYQSSTKAFKEKAVLSSPYNFIKNNKGKDYYYRICSLAANISNPTSFTRGTI